MKAICIHDISGLSEAFVRKSVEDARATQDPKLLMSFYNLDRGEIFFEWEATNPDKINQLHKQLGLNVCRELTPVTEVKVAP